MCSAPLIPKIYHITHVQNLPNIIQSQVLMSDAMRIEKSAVCKQVGMSKIKKRRLEEIEVSCHKGTKVGEYVPFYFCPRSVMLYILYKGNHLELKYKEGQNPIVHLQADFSAVVEWANQHSVPWAFTDRNAGSYLVKFYNDPNSISQIDWNAIDASDFRDPQVKEGKQAEFLLYKSLPWALVEEIGTVNNAVADRVRAVMGDQCDTPVVKVMPRWYF